MPSRFAFFSSKETIEARFSVNAENMEFYEYYNLKPTNRTTSILIEDGQKKLVRARWGFVSGNKFFKARAESASEKRLFGKAMRERRNLILANGFFEWNKDDSGSTPYYFTLKDEEVFGIAGLYNSFFDDDDQMQKYTTAVLTVESNEVVAEIFHRMPVIISKADEEAWLDPSTDLEDLKKMMKPFDSSKMEKWEVDPLPARGDNGPDTIKKATKSASLDDFF